MRARFVLFVLFFLLTPSLLAHPHVWADVKAEVTIAGGYVEGVWTAWTFDEVFSQLILADYPAGPTGQFDGKTLEKLKKGYFDNLKTYQYFSHFGLGDRTIPVPTPQKFQATVAADSRITYRFFLPLGLRLDAKNALAVSFYDDSFFTDMTFDTKNPVKLSVTDGGRASVTLKKNPAKTFYGGQVTPIYAFIAWSPS